MSWPFEQASTYLLFIGGSPSGHRYGFVDRSTMRTSEPIDFRRPQALDKDIRPSVVSQETFWTNDEASPMPKSLRAAGNSQPPRRMGA